MARIGDALWYDDVHIGIKVPPQSVELTVPVMIRWCTAAEIFGRDHCDYEYAVNDLKLPHMVGSGWWTQARLFKLLHDWVGEEGWVFRVRHEIRASLYPDRSFTFAGTVIRKQVKHGFGYVDVDLTVSQQEGDIPVRGNGTVVLPIRNGKCVPYPFTDASLR